MSEQTTFTVTGMTCGNCEKHVRHAAEHVPGVTSVEVDPDLSQGAQVARIGVDELQLFGRAAPVLGRQALARPRQLPQARDAHGVEFVQVGGADRKESQPFQ